MKILSALALALFGYFMIRAGYEFVQFYASDASHTREYAMLIGTHALTGMYFFAGFIFMNLRKLA